MSAGYFVVPHEDVSQALGGFERSDARDEVVRQVHTDQTRHFGHCGGHRENVVVAEVEVFQLERNAIPADDPVVPQVHFSEVSDQRESFRQILQIVACEVDLCLGQPRVPGLCGSADTCSPASS